MGKTRKNNGERKLIFGAVILLIISAILFGLATDQGMNLIKNIQLPRIILTILLEKSLKVVLSKTTLRILLMQAGI